MEKCDICGRETSRIHKTWGYKLCSKHMHQYHKYGKFLDNIQRTNQDLNDYVIDGDVVIFNLYGQNNMKNGEFKIDLEDLEKVKYHKWRLSTSHVATGLPYRGTQRDLSYVILDLPKNYFSEHPDAVVDHINCDPMDNRKENLRLTTQGANVKNKSFMSSNTSGFIGIWYDKRRQTWNPEIGNEYRRVHLRREKTLKEAVYARYIAEETLFKEFTNKEEHDKKWNYCKDLPEERKEEIRSNTLTKLKDKGMLEDSGD